MSKKRSARKTQHRPEAEDKKRNRQLAEAKREVHQLRRQVARLQKEVVKTTSFEPAEESPMVKAPVELRECCPACNEVESFKVMELGPRKFKVCGKCAYRRVTLVA